MTAAADTSSPIATHPVIRWAGPIENPEDGAARVKRNLAVVATALRMAGFESVLIEYEGANDSPDPINVCLYESVGDREAKPCNITARVQLELCEKTWNRKKEKYDVRRYVREDAFKDAMYWAHLDVTEASGHGTYWADSGGKGTLTIDRDGDAQLDHTTYFVSFTEEVTEYNPLDIVFPGPAVEPTTKLIQKQPEPRESQYPTTF